MKIAVVGAGWAGLAAASECMARGMSVTLYDASHQPGGRARGVVDPSLGELDNGQHLFIGSYEKSLELIRREVGADRLRDCFTRLPLWLESADGRFRIRKQQNPALPAFDDIWALWRAKGLTLKDKWGITNLLRRLRSAKPSQTASEITVQQWLYQERQSFNSCRWLWYPLCLATLNTEPSRACASIFQKVLTDSLLSAKPDATNLLIPTCNLSDLWPIAVARKAINRIGHVVRAITPQSDSVTIDGTPFDACVLAVPPPSLMRLISGLPGFEVLVSELKEFTFRSIATCYVALDKAPNLPAPLLMFDHAEIDPARHAQWAFDRNAFMRTPQKAQLSFVMSCADALPVQDDVDVARMLINQLNRALPKPLQGKILGARCFREKRATFDAVPGLKRPGTKTPHRRIMLAGDWTDTGYPSVIEGAVISGIKTADALQEMRGY